MSGISIFHTWNGPEKYARDILAKTESLNITENMSP